MAVIALALRLAAAVSTPGQGWQQLGDLGLAFVLSAAIGLEREFRNKDAGLRTHTLVGLGAAMFMLVSKYGFNDVLQSGRVVVDPSRVAAQIVTGIGFIGAGVIFVRRDAVRGLTTAAAVWVTAAIAATAAAGLPVLAAAATGLYFVVALVFSLLSHRLPPSATAVSVLRVRYRERQGVLRNLLHAATEEGFVVDEVTTERGPGSLRHEAPEGPDGHRVVEVAVSVHGKRSVHELAATFTELQGVEGVDVQDVNAGRD